MLPQSSPRACRSTPFPVLNVGTNDILTDYYQVLRDRFQKAGEKSGSSQGTRVEVGFSGAWSMLESIFVGRTKQADEESDNDKANRIIDELDACFTSTLKSSSAHMDGQGQRRQGGGLWNWMKPW